VKKEEIIDFKVFIWIDCYKCGEKIFIPFSFVSKSHHADYGRCNSCGSSIELSFNPETSDLSIRYLQVE
jgi:DNA-directed RNA polymerase subunit RPC12/RpoP